MDLGGPGEGGHRPLILFKSNIAGHFATSVTISIISQTVQTPENGD